MGNDRNAWRKKKLAEKKVAPKKAKRNKRASNPDPNREGPKDGPDIAAIPKVGSLRQWDKNMKTEARIRRRPSGVAIRTNPDPPASEPEKA